MKTLISLGCSFAFGDGLKDDSKRYSVLLAKKYNRRLLDYSLGGVSNEYIAASCAAAIKSALEASKPEDIVVITGWTDQARIMLFDNRQKDIITVFPYQNRTNTTPLDGFIGKHAWHDSFGIYKLYHSYNYVNMLCKAHNIKCIHFASIPPRTLSSSKDQKANPRTQRLFDIFNSEDRVEFNKLFSDSRSFLGMIYSDAKRFSISKDNYHPNEEAHRCWAEKISEANHDILGS